MSDAADRYKARFQREKTARKEAERLLEEKSRDLYQMNQDLQSLAESLEHKVSERTSDLQKAKDEAVQHAKVKSDFLANMSHELRTPMNGVLGMLNLLEDAPLDKRYRKIVKTAALSGNLLLKLINDILDFTKLENNKLELESLAFDPIELVEFAVEPFFAEAIDKGIDLLTQIPPSIPTSLISDSTRIQQIITNLVSNAIKFTHEGYVLVQCFYEQDTFILRVVDSGIGMSSEQSAKIFSAFSQADESTTRKYGGTGLGLSICKNLISMMQGQLYVESQPNSGTTFTAEIPMKSEGGHRPAPQSSLLSPTTCIVALEHLLERSIIEECFIHWQTQVRPAPPELASIEQLLSSENINLLVVDDGMNEHFNELKMLVNTYPGLHIVFFTKLEHVHHDAAQFTCLNKPIKRSELFDTIAEVCGFARINIGRKKGSKKPRFKGQNILLVEDNLVNQEVAKELLSSVNLNVSIANNGQEACDMLAQQAFEQAFELVLMDIQMPIMDGISATQTIRSWEGEYQTLPIFAMTAHNLKGDSEKSIRAGMNKHITKPIVPKVLFEALAEYLANEDDNNISGEHASPPLMTESDGDTQPVNQQSDMLSDLPIDLPRDLPGIDLIDALERVAGNKTILIKLLGLFKEQQQNFVIDFEQALALANMESTVRLAHTLKGSAANSGAMTLSSLASDLERYLKNIEPSNDLPSLDLSHVQGLLQAISNELQRVFNSIDIVVASPKTVKPNTEIDPHLAMTLLVEIELEVYSDLSVVGDNIQTLYDSFKNTAYDSDIKALSKAFDIFDHDSILEHANTLQIKLQKDL